jgi:hypothetical protein
MARINIIELSQNGMIGSRSWTYTAMDEYAYAFAKALKIKRGYCITISTPLEYRTVFSASQDVREIDSIIYGAVKAEAERWAQIPELTSQINDTVDRTNLFVPQRLNRSNMRSSECRNNA